jgi:hypothetical protein
VSKTIIYECDECGCVLGSQTLKETVTISDFDFHFCFDCFQKSVFRKFYTKKVEEGKAPAIHIWLENLPVNNGWDGKKSFLNKITYRKEK